MSRDRNINFGQGGVSQAALDAAVALLAPKAAPTFTGILTHAGQIKFPAAVNQSADPNTLDDYQEGTFTATLTGFAAGPTGDVRFVKVGRVVTLHFPAINGTSNATAMTITGLPAELRPGTDLWQPFVFYNNSTRALGLLIVGTGGNMDCYTSFEAAAFAATGVKGVQPCSMTYLAAA